MRTSLDSAGVHLELESALSWVTEVIEEGASGELQPSGSAPKAAVGIHIDGTKGPFDTTSWAPLTRGAWRRNGELVIENACTAGFDVRLECTTERADFYFRWHPPARDRVLARALRSRFHLLARAILVQYPALWWAGTQGRAPLHASACAAGESTVLLSAPSGIGRSTLILAELAHGGHATDDNISVGDGTTVWGLVEPLRVEGAAGRRMPHGRAELPFADRADSLVPRSVIVLQRDGAESSSLSPCGAEAAARSLVTSTYMAGELRRYWAFAAMLSAGTGIGPSAPPIETVTSAFAARLPCFTLSLGTVQRPTLSELLRTQEIAA